jgi:hypothetical protein
MEGRRKEKRKEEKREEKRGEKGRKEERGYISSYKNQIFKITCKACDERGCVGPESVNGYFSCYLLLNY